jgi:hypothetical protein
VLGNPWVVSGGSCGWCMGMMRIVRQTTGFLRVPCIWVDEKERVGGAGNFLRDGDQLTAISGIPRSVCRILIDALVGSIYGQLL